MSKRGSGQTKAQMLKAPREAIFVWCNGHLYYPRALARHLGRDDLEIISPEALQHGKGLIGRKLSRIIVDHAAHLNCLQFETLRKVSALTSTTKT